MQVKTGLGVQLLDLDVRVKWGFHLIYTLADGSPLCQLQVWAQTVFLCSLSAKCVLFLTHRHWHFLSQKLRDHFYFLPWHLF